MGKQKVERSGSGPLSPTCGRRPGLSRRSGQPIRVILVDREPLFRKCLGSVLSASRDIEVVGQAGTASEAEAITAAMHPDIVVTDFSLPDAPAGGVLEQFRDKVPGLRVVVLTAVREQGAITKCLSEGAQGYVLKDATPALVVKAIRAVHAGETWVQREVVGELTEELRRVSYLSHRNNAEGGLSDREVQVLRLLAAGNSTADISAQLFISQSTVRAHVTRILDKLGLKNRIEAVRYAIKTGLVQL